MPRMAQVNRLLKETFADCSIEAAKMAISQSTLNKEQIELILSSKGLTGNILETTTAELANTTATNAMAATEGTATTATVGFGTAIKGLGASLKALAVAHPILLAITVTLGAIAGAVKIVDALTTSMKEQREAFENAQQDYTDACTKLDELKTKLSETTNRIAELIEKSNNGTITLVEQAELDKLEASLVNQYNDIIEYIKKYYPDTTYSSIQQQYIGWSNITSVYYNIIDLYSYLNSSMMPTWKQQDKTAASQLALLTPSNLSPVAVTDVSKISVYTANNAVLAMAKAIIDTSIYTIGGWNINDEAIYHDQGNYRVYLQKATSPDTWTFSCQEKRDGVYYANFYIKQNGEMYASNAKITGEINATKLTASGYGWSGGSTYKMVASLIGGEMKISNETDGSYFSIQGHGVFARNNRNFNTLTLISNSKDGSADGMTITGESGTEVQVLRDGIKMWHMPNRTKMTWIGKGEISIDTGGTRSFSDAALSVFGDIKATGIYCMHGTEQRKMAVVLNRLEASNSDISMSWDGQFLRFWVDDTVINTWDNDNKTWC